MATAKTGVRLPAMASCRKERRLVWAALLAAIWSLAYGLLGAYWAVGGAGFPYGPRGDGTPGWMSLIDDTRHDFGGLVIAVLGTTGAMAALAMACGRGRGVGRAALLGFAWTLTAILLLVVPDARVLALVGYLPALVFALGFEAVDWPMLNQVACLAGGAAWFVAALAYQRGRGMNGDEGRTCGASADDPCWGRWAAWAAVLLPLPYAVTRLAWAVGFPLGITNSVEAAWATSPSARINELSLGGMALGGALLTLGLVRPWGEVCPRWLPGAGGQRVPPMFVVVPAAVAATILTAGGLAVWRMVLSEGIDDGGWVGALAGLAFLPWGVALALTTIAYHMRRSHGRTGAPSVLPATIAPGTVTPRRSLYPPMAFDYTPKS